VEPTDLVERVRVFVDEKLHDGSRPLLLDEEGTGASDRVLQPVGSRVTRLVDPPDPRCLVPLSGPGLDVVAHSPCLDA